ncbi:MAG: T9SS type A sorting domain-containing protein [Lentimicrobiaceae bacterium]|nr:T9SS type A sorting domain-containing protein [Lentimicrobiaceae bacterium]
MKKTLLLTIALLLNAAVFSQSRATLLNESFDKTSLPSGWKVMGDGAKNWSIAKSDNAGGKPNELDLFWDPIFKGTSRMVMTPLDLTNVPAIAISFKHYLDYYPYYEGTCTIGVATSSDNGATWNDGWRQEYDKTDRYVVDEIIKTDDMGKANVLVCLYFEGNTNDINSWQFDDILIFSQEANDAELTSVDVPSNLGNGYNYVTFTVRNLGSSTIESFEAKYQVEGSDNFISETFETNIETFASEQFTFKKANFFSEGDITLNVEVTSVNGEDDDFNDNNINSKDIFVGMSTVQKISMIEHFSSSTCFPCVFTNKDMDTLTQNNAGRFTYVKYPMNGPAPGDPYYISDCNTRRTYYGVNNVPTLFLDGTTKFTNYAISQEKMDISYNTPSFFDIRGSFTLNDSTITVIADFMPYINIKNLKAYVTVNEKTTTKNIGSNGETEFHHILMKMLGSPSGTKLDFEAGTYQRLEFSHDMTSTNVEELDDLEVAIWIQNPTTKEVLNSRFAYEYTEHVYPAQNVNITITGNDPKAVVSWEAPSQGTPDGYNIIIDGKLIKENIEGLTFTDEATAWNVYDGLRHIVEVVAVYEGGRKSVSAIGKINDEVNVNEFKENQIACDIYPNPVKDELTIATEANVEEIAIYDIYGRTMRQQVNKTTGQQVIDVDDLENGIYFINIKTDKGNIVRRFIKN